jgi:hypothetical protein
MGLVSAVILFPESCGAHDHTLVSQIRDSPNLEGQVRLFTTMSTRDKMAQLVPQALGSLSVAVG